jgi:hypothetical protein
MTSTSPAPTGTVSFLNGKVSLGTGTLNSSGIATLATGSLPVGTDSITASYGGDSHYAATVSSPVSVKATGTAKPTLTVKLTASAASASYGSPVTLTATLSGSGAKPTGSLAFIDGTMQVGTATLNSSGVATSTSSSLALGVHSITASYVGDSNYGPASSTAVSVTVSK